MNPEQSAPKANTELWKIRDELASISARVATAGGALFDHRLASKGVVSAERIVKLGTALAAIGAAVDAINDASCL